MSFLFVLSFDFKQLIVLLYGKTIRKHYVVLYIMMIRTATYNKNHTQQDLGLRSNYTVIPPQPFNFVLDICILNDTQKFYFFL